MLEYLLYALAFIAVILAVEGAWRLARANLGEERAVKRRLARGRSAAVSAATTPQARPDALSVALDARFPRLARRSSGRGRRSVLVRWCLAQARCSCWFSSA